jgi:hypothetical protein
MTPQILPGRWCRLQTTAVAACIIGSLNGPLGPMALGDSPFFVEKSDRQITVGLDFSRMLKKTNRNPTNKVAAAANRSVMKENPSNALPVAAVQTKAPAGVETAQNPTNSARAAVAERPVESRPMPTSSAVPSRALASDPYRQQRINDAVRAANQQMRDEQSAIVGGISNGADRGAYGVFHPF